MSLVTRKPRIQDEFTDLPLSQSQKKYRLAMRDARCVKCGQPRCDASNTLCLRHWQPIFDESERKRLAREQRMFERIQETKNTHWEVTQSEIERRKSLTIPLPTIGKYHYYKPKR